MRQQFGHRRRIRSPQRGFEIVADIRCHRQSFIQKPPNRGFHLIDQRTKGGIV